MLGIQWGNVATIAAGVMVGVIALGIAGKLLGAV